MTEPTDGCTCTHYVVDLSDPDRYHPENVDREDDPGCPVHGIVADPATGPVTVQVTEPGMPALVFSGEACRSWMDRVNDMRGWAVTATLTDGAEVDGAILGADFGNDGYAVLRILSGGATRILSTDDFTSLFIH